MPTTIPNDTLPPTRTSTRPDEERPVLSIDALTKTFGSFTLGPIDLRLESGRVTALVGRNGAGKTTLLDCMAGLQRPSSGTVRSFGHDVIGHDVAAKHRVGYATDAFPVFERWSVIRTFAFLSRYYTTWSTDFARELARRLDLPLEKPVRLLSKGNRTKVGIVASLAHRPKLVLLDEPTSGLDPLARNELMTIMRDYVAQEGATVMYSSHILSDLAEISDDVVFLSAGRVIVRNSLEALHENFRLVTFECGGWLPNEVLRHAATIHWCDGRYEALTSEPAAFTSLLRSHGLPAISVEETSLQVVTERLLRDGAEGAA